MFAPSGRESIQRGVGRFRASLVAAFAVSVAGCGGGLQAAPSAAPATSPTASTAALTVTDAQNGTSIAISVGQAVDIVLGSTYWIYAGSSNVAVLAPQGEPQFLSLRSDCVPGAGCGSVSQSFLALSPGTADFHASRMACGEALACPPDRQQFVVTVNVSP